MKELIAKLVELQEVLKKIYDLKKLNARLPRNIKALRAQFDPKKKALSQKQAEIERMKSLQQSQETELATRRDSVASLDEKMKLIKTQKEYNALSLEKEFLEGEISQFEAEIKNLKKRAESLEKEVAETSGSFEEEEAKIQTEEARIAEMVAEHQTAIDELEKEKEKMVPGIDKAVLARFERILNSKDGIGIVKIVNGSCDGCHMVVPPQLVGNVYKGDKFYNCLNCSRLLYIQE